jgi:DNA-binding NtrC family response regulator
MSEKVLLVDDEQDFLEIMAERMRARDMEVHTCTSADEALRKIKDENFDAIILDFMMPGMDGMQALKEMKAKSPESQIILLTGHATIEKSVEAMKLGATDFLEKPADLRELEKKIKDASTKRIMIVEKQAEARIKDVLRRFGG